MDITSSLRIAATVSGQQAIERLNGSMGQLTGLAKSAGLALVGLGAGLSVGVIKEKFDGVVESILRVGDAVDKTGSSFEKIGGIIQVAKITGDNFDEIENGILKMQKALSATDDISRGAAHALDTIGLSVKELRQMDPADAFSKIALALDDFEDGTGKTAIAMDIFGESGAKLLPFLKDYVELGGEVGKVTQQQQEDADAYSRAIKRLQASTKDLYKTIATQILPVATDFTGALLDVTNGTNGVKQAAKQLADDGSMTAFFREAARAGAALLDILSGAWRLTTQLAESLGVIWNDIKTGAEIVTLGIGAGFTEEGRAAIRKALADRDAYMQRVGQSFEQRWSTGMTPYSDALEARFAKRDAGGDGKPDQKKRSLAGYTTATATPKTEKDKQDDPFGDALDGLGSEAAKLQFQIKYIELYDDKISSAKAAQVQFDIEQGKFADLSDKQKTMLLMQAQAVDTLTEKLRQAKEGMAYDKATRDIEANTRALTMSNVEREIAVALQDLENKGIKAGTELYEQLAQRRIAAIRAQQAEATSWRTGMMQALNEYTETAGNMAMSTKNLVTNAFKGMEDAIVQFATTGKLNFRSLAASIITDMIRIQAQQAITSVLNFAISAFAPSPTPAGGGANYSLGTGGGGFGEVKVPAGGGIRFAGGGYTGNGPRSGGLDGQGGFMAMLHPQETVIDHARGQRGGGGGTNVVVNVNVERGSEQVSTNAGAAGLGKAISAAVRAELIQQKRPGGLLAA